jgi:hypothetical protein
LEVPVNPDETPLDDDDGPNLGLSQIECFLFAFHRLLHRAPEFFVERKENGEKAEEAEVSEKLADLRKRLNYLSRRVQKHIRNLREKLQGKTGEQLKQEENKLRLVALRTTSNVNALTRDFFHKPPSFKTNVSLSWKPASARPVVHVATGCSSARLSHSRTKGSTWGDRCTSHLVESIRTDWISMLVPREVGAAPGSVVAVVAGDQGEVTVDLADPKLF